MNFSIYLTSESTVFQFDLTIKLSRLGYALHVQSQEKVKSEDTTCSAGGQKAEVLPGTSGKLTCTLSQVMLTAFRGLKS